MPEDFSDVTSGSSSQPAGPPARTGDAERDFYELMRYAAREAASARLRGDTARYEEYRKLVLAYGAKFQAAGAMKDRLDILQQFGRDVASVPAAIGTTVLGASQWIPLVVLAVVLVYGEKIIHALGRGSRGTTWE